MYGAIIVGADPAGLSVALWLGHSRWPVSPQQASRLSARTHLRSRPPYPRAGAGSVKSAVTDSVLYSSVHSSGQKESWRHGHQSSRPQRFGRNPGGRQSRHGSTATGVWGRNCHGVVARVRLATAIPSWSTRRSATGCGAGAGSPSAARSTSRAAPSSTSARESPRSPRRS